MIKHLIPILLLSASCAAETELVLGGLSYHIGERIYSEVNSEGYYTGETKHFNERNTTVGLCVDNTCAVASKLSYYNWGIAVYHELEFDFMSTDHIKTGVRIGGVWGYEDTPQGGFINPLVQPIVSIPYKKWEVQFGLIPTDPLVLTLNAKYKF